MYGHRARERARAVRRGPRESAERRAAESSAKERKVIYIGSFFLISVERICSRSPSQRARPSCEIRSETPHAEI